MYAHKIIFAGVHEKWNSNETPKVMESYIQMYGNTNDMLFAWQQCIIILNVGPFASTMK